MKKVRISVSWIVIILAIQLVYAQDPNANAPRERLLMDFGWRFALGHACDTVKDFGHGGAYFSYFAKAGNGDGPAAKNFDDRGWRILDLPHDWAVELPFDSTASYSHGFKPLGHQFPETSIGWYRKTFVIPAADLGKRISVEFDGVHRNSTVWVNGFYLGQEHCGYYGFQYDITDYLNYGGENVVAVRVDATMEEGWYYEGAGIYRHTWLNKTAPLHVTWYGTFVSSEIKDSVAVVTTRATIINENNKESSFDLDQTIINAEGKTVTRAELKQLTLKPYESQEYAIPVSISRPGIWSIEDPNLYKLITTIFKNGSVIDRYETSFGIRSVKFDPEQGFFLNGQHVLLKGTNNHQDHAGVGTALPDALQEFRVKRLKEMGSNAYRCSHNPATPELLNSCDRLGMLVIDENRLLGSNTEHLDLLKRMILRDRNHPSVFIWSIGNEEWAIEGNITGARIAMTMQDFVKHLDPTRRVIYASSGWGSGISDVQDVMGFNYIFNGDIDRQHARFPDQPAIGTEETTSRSSRGIYEDNPGRAHLAPTDRTPGGRSLEDGFKFYAARPFLSGIFYWTGFDYRGEPHPFGWPQVSSQSGIVDLCGFPKDMFYYLKSRWTTEPVLHIFPHWNWPGKEGQSIQVWAYTNCDEVELFLNGQSLGRKPVPVNSHIEWPVEYKPGTLLGRGYKDSREIITTRIETTDAAKAIKLITDRPIIRADGQDVSVITVQVNDDKGNMVPTAENTITFKLHGPGRIIGVGNGDPSSHEPDRYFESIALVKITELRIQKVQGLENPPESAFNFNDSQWPSAFKTAGEEIQKTAQEIVIRGSFDLPELTDSTEITLLPKSLGEVQAIYVNGYLIVKNVKRDDQNQKYKLDRAILHPGRNVYALAATPLVKRTQWEILNTDPGLLQVYTPSKPWKCNLFSGLAQVILQSTRDPGEFVLTVVADGLATGLIKLKSESVKRKVN
jgi:beta-galactosidase